MHDRKRDAITGPPHLSSPDVLRLHALLCVHLGVVLALFLSLPYGKFVHGLYRFLALVKYAAERKQGTFVE